MGEISDYYHDKALEAEAKIEYYIEDIKEAYQKGILKWQTKNGNKILIQTMTTDHIKNCIKFIQRENDINNYTEAIIDILNQELNKR